MQAVRHVTPFDTVNARLACVFVVALSLAAERASAQQDEVILDPELSEVAPRVVAPATANIMSQLATGTATGLLTTLCLASEAPLVLAPAMNQAMWRNPATQGNLAILRDRGVRFIGPADGEQACGDVGPGRMTEPDAIAEQLFAEQLFTDREDSAAGATAQRLGGVKVLISAGPTREPIDPVRFISNRSSGKMGFAVAKAAADAGALVTLVAGPVNLATPPGIERVDVETAAQMYEAVVGRAELFDIYIGAAAISDYRPEVVQSQKIKKHADKIEFAMVRSPDVLAEVAKLKARPFTVGFAAETEKLEQYSRAKLVGKSLDMIVGNLVCNDLCFDQDENGVLILWHGGHEEIERMAKTELARRIIEVIEVRYRQATNSAAPIRQPAS